MYSEIVGVLKRCYLTPIKSIKLERIIVEPIQESADYFPLYN